MTQALAGRETGCAGLEHRDAVAGGQTIGVRGGSCRSGWKSSDIAAGIWQRGAAGAGALEGARGGAGRGRTEELGVAPRLGTGCCCWRAEELG